MAIETRAFGTGADDSGTGATPWTNPTNALVSDDTRATVSLGSNGQSHYLKVTNSSHQSGSTLASGDTISQIIWHVEKRKAGNPAANIQDLHAYPVEGGTIVTTTDFKDTGIDWSATDGVVDYIQTTNLPSADTVLLSTWGFVLACQNTNSQVGGQGEVDQTTAEITFTAATPAPALDGWGIQAATTIQFMRKTTIEAYRTLFDHQHRLLLAAT